MREAQSHTSSLRRTRLDANLRTIVQSRPIRLVSRMMKFGDMYHCCFWKRNILGSAGSLAESMKLEPYQMYQPSPSNHQQTGPPPSYYETQYQRNNSLRSGSSPYGLPPTPQSTSQQRCQHHRLQPCACQMVSKRLISHMEDIKSRQFSYVFIHVFCFNRTWAPYPECRHPTLKAKSLVHRR